MNLALKIKKESFICQRQLVSHIESELSRDAARIVLVETAGLDEFDYVRSFYNNSGYREEARIGDFYTEGMDKVVYWKRLQTPEATK